MNSNEEKETIDKAKNIEKNDSLKKRVSNKEEKDEKKEIKTVTSNKKNEENKLENTLVIKRASESNFDPVQSIKKEKKKNTNLVMLFFTIVFGIVVGSIIVISILKWTPILSKIENSVSDDGSGVIETNTQKNTVYEKSS